MVRLPRIFEYPIFVSNSSAILDIFVTTTTKLSFLFLALSRRNCLRYQYFCAQNTALHKIRRSQGGEMEHTESYLMQICRAQGCNPVVNTPTGSFMHRSVLRTEQGKIQHSWKQIISRWDWVNCDLIYNRNTQYKIIFNEFTLKH
jgi:hypothetical protein